MDNLTFGSAILQQMFVDCGTNLRESNHTRERRYSQPPLPATAFARRISYVRPRDSTLARDKPGPAHKVCAGALWTRSIPETFHLFRFITYIIVKYLLVVCCDAMVQSLKEMVGSIFV